MHLITDSNSVTIPSIRRRRGREGVRLKRYPTPYYSGHRVPRHRAPSPYPCAPYTVKATNGPLNMIGSAQIGPRKRRAMSAWKHSSAAIRTSVRGVGSEMPAGFEIVDAMIFKAWFVSGSAVTLGQGTSADESTVSGASDGSSMLGSDWYVL
jgi:hypothetical protein